MNRARRRRYIRRSDTFVVAVQLLLDTDGLVYQKWGSEQRAKAGDWIVDNGGDVYTVDAAVFARTYRPAKQGPGTYVKVTAIWAEQAEKAGVVQSKEGLTHYAPGDYIVSNSNDGTDQYAIAAKKFEELYIPAEEDQS